MAELERIELNVQGMTCNSCARYVEKALNGVGSVQAAQVPGWESGRAEVTAEGDVTAEELAAAVRDAGYEARVEVRTPLQRPSAGDGGGDSAGHLNWAQVVAQVPRGRLPATHAGSSSWWSTLPAIACWGPTSWRRRRAT